MKRRFLLSSYNPLFGPVQSLVELSRLDQPDDHALVGRGDDLVDDDALGEGVCNLFGRPAVNFALRVHLIAIKQVVL